MQPNCMLTAEFIESRLPESISHIYIGYSGGMDSHVLLHLLSQSAELTGKISAIHINHGLSAESCQWQKHCQKTAGNLQIDFHSIRVDAKAGKGESPEEAARIARYQALKDLLDEQDILLFAQHREDQMETLLIQLFRGAGVKGLAAMPAMIEFGLGKLCRPFLDISWEQIRAYAKQHNLYWVEDPSNKDIQFDRNFLRQQIIPQLKQRWPSLDQSVARSARHCAAMQEFSEAIISRNFQEIYRVDNKALMKKALSELDVFQQQLILRKWLSLFKQKMPSTTLVNRVIEEIIQSPSNAVKQVQSKQYTVISYQNLLYCLRPSENIAKQTEIPWPNEQKTVFLGGNQHLSLFESQQGIAKHHWQDADVVIKFRQGQEKIKLPGRKGHHSLKKLYQSQRIPPWERVKIPLIYLNNELAAVADLWISADFYSMDKTVDCFQFKWNKPDFYF